MTPAQIADLLRETQRLQVAARATHVATEDFIILARIVEELLAHQKQRAEIAVKKSRRRK